MSPATSIRLPNVIATIATTSLLLSACSTPSVPAAQGDSASGSPARAVGADRGVLILGDSVAEQEGIALTASLGAAGIKVTNGAADGSSLTLTPDVADKIARKISAAAPGIVIYQLGVMDFGSESQQREAYEALAAIATKFGVQLLLVTNPPIKAIEGDKFQSPEKIAELARLPKIAADIANTNPASVKSLDATPLWGAEYKQTGSNSDKPIRADDGIHLCVTGAAVLANWLPEQMSALYDGITPAKPESWINGPWTKDRKMAAFPSGCATNT